MTFNADIKKEKTNRLPDIYLKYRPHIYINF